ncbi:MAG: hypothetical protein SFT91_01100 [Rickettsiaceae bacterium]|nr:hypothetical protein [Rickettsiaceae bacterium]
MRQIEANYLYESYNISTLCKIYDGEFNRDKKVITLDPVGGFECNGDNDAVFNLSVSKTVENQVNAMVLDSSDYSDKHDIEKRDAKASCNPY